MENALIKTESDSIQAMLRQLNGPGTGRDFDIGSSRVTIGRSEGNHIVVEDESVSRVHAYIEQNDDGSFFIFDNQSRNGVVVNGKKVDVSILQRNDSIQIGSIKFSFDLLGMGSLPEDNKRGLLGSGSSKKPKINKRVALYGGAGVVLLVVLLLNNKSEQPVGKSEKKANESKSLEAPTFVASPESNTDKIADPSQNPVEKELEAFNQSDSGIIESETYFRRGQREFFNKNYHRAINSFEVALSLNRNHPAAGYYLKSAIYQAEREAQKHFETGLKYFESLQYQRAIYHFQQTQALLAHKQKDSLLGQVDKYIKLSRQRLQAAEMFP